MQYICFNLLAATAIFFDEVTGRKRFESPQQRRRARNVDEIADTVANVADGYNQSDFRFLTNETRRKQPYSWGLISSHKTNHSV